ncbi:MAG TPA: zinc ribbon domain-containing protein [Phycisphaerae bacterium]|nr:zinc ribbon domain-containing protein [Phycisphaerae bacterium]
MDPSEANSRSPVLPAGLPEDWVFERDLPCPQCRYNLRMLHLPRCPECGTIFRWQALVHIVCPRCGQSLREIDQAVCPRCALALAWERLLGEAPLGKRELYEYSDRPFRAAMRTWVAVLLPRRFWKAIPIELTPAIDRLLRLRRIATVFCVAGLLSLLSTALFTRRGFGAWLTTCAIAFGLPALTALMLPRFTPTLARFNVRRDQLLRCLAYGSIGRGWVGLLFVAASIWGHVRSGLVPPPWWRAGVIYFDLFWFLESASRWLFTSRWWRDYELLIITVVGVLFLWLALAWWWRFLYVSLRHYLRLDPISAVALFLSTQVIALLALMLVLTFALLLTSDGQRLLAGT